MSVKIDDKDIADVKIGETQISSIYAGTNLIWQRLDYYLIITRSKGGEFSFNSNKQLPYLFEDGIYYYKYRLGNTVSVVYNSFNGSRGSQEGMLNVIFPINSKIEYKDITLPNSDTFFIDANNSNVNITLEFGTGVWVKEVIIKNAVITSIPVCDFTTFGTLNFENLNTSNVKAYHEWYTYGSTAPDSIRNIMEQYTVTNVCTSIRGILRGANWTNGFENISKWNVENVTNAYRAFANTSGYIGNLTAALSFNTLSNCSEMYSNSKIENIDTSSWTLNNANCQSMFQNCSSLTSSIVLKGSISAAASMFQNSSKLTDIDISNVDFSNCTNMSSIFNGCSNLTNIGITNMTLNNANCSQMFRNCKALASPITLKGSISNAASMFNGCTNLTDAGDFSNMTLNNANCSQMFDGCSSLSSPITLKGSISAAVSMFQSCTNITDIDLSNVDFSDCTNMSSMFNNCSKLKDLGQNTDLSTWQTDKVTSMASMFFFNYVLPQKYFTQIEDWNTVECTDMGAMFRTCRGLVDFSPRWNTKKVKNFNYTFANCSNMRILDISTWETDSATNVDAFYGCSADVKFGQGWFNTNVGTINIQLENLGKDNIKILLNCLLNHPKNEDEEWDGQYIRMSNKTITVIDNDSELSALRERVETETIWTIIT